MTTMKTKNKGTKKCVIKRKLKFEVYKHCLKATQLESKRNKLNVDIKITRKGTFGQNHHLEREKFVMPQQ